MPAAAPVPVPVAPAVVPPAVVAPATQGVAASQGADVARVAAAAVPTDEDVELVMRVVARWSLSWSGEAKQIPVTPELASRP